MTSQPTVQWQVPCTGLPAELEDDEITTTVTLPCNDLITASASVITRWDSSSGVVLWRTSNISLPSAPSDHRVLQSVLVPSLSPNLILMVITVKDQIQSLPVNCSIYGVLLNATTGTITAWKFLDRFTADVVSELMIPVAHPNSSSYLLVCGRGLSTDEARWTSMNLYDVGSLRYVTVINNVSCSSPILHMSAQFVALSMVAPVAQSLSSLEQASMEAPVSRWIVYDCIAKRVLTSAVSLDPACERFALVSLTPSTQPVLSQLALVCSSSSTASAVRVSDGVLLWSVPAAPSGSPVGDLVDVRWQVMQQQPIVFIVRMNLVYELRAVNGTVLWTSTPEPCCASQINTYILADIIIRSYAYGTLRASSLSSGLLLWTLRTSTEASVSLALAQAGHSFYQFGSDVVTAYRLGTLFCVSRPYATSRALLYSQIMMLCFLSMLPDMQSRHLQSGRLLFLCR